MNSRDAKQILFMHRPGVHEHDPQVAEALQQAGRDPELAAWLQRQYALVAEMRVSWQAAPVPPGLAEVIRRRRRQTSASWGKPILQLAAAVILLLGLGVYWLQQREQPARFADYRQAMAQLIQHGYRMSYLSDDADAVRQFLRANQAPADFQLPPQAADTKLLGCATLSWNGNPVSLLCFRRPEADLWLFVSHRNALPDAPPSSASIQAQAGNLHTASWTDGEIVYLAATRGESGLPGFNR